MASTIPDDHTDEHHDHRQDDVRHIIEQALQGLRQRRKLERIDSLDQRCNQDDRENEPADESRRLRSDADAR